MTAPAFQLENWKDHPDLLTDSLWQLGARARGEGRNGGKYHGNFVPQIVDQMVRRYTQPGERVLDLFAGSGTTLVECLRLGRHSVGVELKPKQVDEVNAHLATLPDPYGVGWELFAGDSTDERIRPRIEAGGQVHHVFLHPPYWDIIRFSSLKADLSTACTLEVFLAMMAQVISNAFVLLEPGRCATLVVADAYRRSEYIPLAFETMNVARRRGFELRAIVVKDMQGNEKGKGKSASLWRYRAFRNGLYVFKHEYIFHLRKPAARKAAV